MAMKFGYGLLNFFDHTLKNGIVKKISDSKIYCGFVVVRNKGKKNRFQSFSKNSKIFVSVAYPALGS